MFETLPIGMPGGGFITHGFVMFAVAFLIVFYFRDEVGKRVSI